MNKYEIEPDEENIYKSLVEDKLDNMEYLNCLITLISNIDENEVICVDGDWGCGKTFLTKQFEYLIKNYIYLSENNKIKKIKNEENLKKIIDNNLIFYYNAWENDDHNDPFESIIYNILNKYPIFKNIVTNSINKEKVLKESLNLLIKIMSKRLLNIDFTSENISEIKTFEDLSDKITTIEEKKRLFKELIDKISNGKRIILIIDELDRCNPLYATKVLETIKHFYNLNNITIIVVANNNELRHVINQQYGENFDSYNYLSKFYDYMITIDNSKSVEYCKKYLNFSNSTYLPHDVFYAMINRYKFTLRDCNRYRTLYDTAKGYIEGSINGWMDLTKNDMTIIYSVILPIILVFKVKDIDAFNKCLNNNNTESLKEAIIYIHNFFKNNNQEDWLYEIVCPQSIRIENNEQELYDKIIDIYLKIGKRMNINKIFMNLIKTVL